MSQRAIETVIGRLISDEAFRDRFLAAPESALLELADRGLELSRSEIAALLRTDRTLWGRAADSLDPRLQKISVPAAAWD